MHATPPDFRTGRAAATPNGSRTSELEGRRRGRPERGDEEDDGGDEDDEAVLGLRAQIGQCIPSDDSNLSEQVRVSGQTYSTMAPKIWHHT